MLFVVFSGKEIGLLVVYGPCCDVRYRQNNRPKSPRVRQISFFDRRDGNIVANWAFPEPFRIDSQ